MRDLVVEECQRYTVKHFVYSNRLPPMNVKEFFLFKSQIFVSFLFNFYSYDGREWVVN